MIKVTDEDISYAEKILLDNDHKFDKERLEFIKDFSTLDLQAVPGSGKTTALLAKLLILEKKLPLPDNRAVLVISHTNTAVDEIKNRIGKFCPKLFSYPNFIGTIQSFVDVFFAIPFYCNYYKQKPYRIDNEIYDEQVEKFYATTPNRTLINYLDRQRDPISFLKSIRLNANWNLISYLNGSEEDFKIKNKETTTYKSLKKFKLNMLSRGYLHFDDAYFLAEYMIEKTPNCIRIVKNRFKFIFIDEMQDMDIHQYNLLEKIFTQEEDNLCVVQRIGDINQAIFNGFSNSKGIWHFRENVKYLKGSHRLSPKIASVVEKLSLTPSIIEGRNKNSDGSEIQIKPILFLYKDENKEDIVEAFSKEITKNIKDGLIPSKAENKYQVVAWRKEHNDEDKFALKDYCPTYNEKSISSKIDFSCLKDYLIHFDQEKRTLEAVRKNILNSILRILRIEDVLDANNKYFTKRTLINKLKGLEGNEFEEFKLLIYTWSIGIIKKDQAIKTSIRSYIPTLLGYFDKKVSKAEKFINNESVYQGDPEKPKDVNNKIRFNEIEIQLGTVHSVKGQTNTATLYLETFYERGYGNYESERLRNQILGKDVSDTLNTAVSSKEKIRKSAKMAYVGFSRPTHLLAFGIHKDRFNDCLKDVDDKIWDIIAI